MRLQNWHDTPFPDLTQTSLLVIWHKHTCFWLYTDTLACDMTQTHLLVIWHRHACLWHDNYYKNFRNCKKQKLFIQNSNLENTNVTYIHSCSGQFQSITRFCSCLPFLTMFWQQHNEYKYKYLALNVYSIALDPIIWHNE